MQINPTLLLMHAMGWQGGTVHQVAEATGLTVEQVLKLNETRPAEYTTQANGWFAVRTCDLEFNLSTNFPKRKGDEDFWYGVMRGQWSKEMEQETANSVK